MDCTIFFRQLDTWGCTIFHKIVGKLGRMLKDGSSATTNWRKMNRLLHWEAKTFWDLFPWQHGTCRKNVLCCDTQALSAPPRLRRKKAWKSFPALRGFTIFRPTADRKSLERLSKYDRFPYISAALLVWNVVSLFWELRSYLRYIFFRFSCQFLGQKSGDRRF